MSKFSHIIFLFLCFHSIVSQTNYTWNGSSSTSWTVATNWTPNGIPGTIDNVIIVSGSNNCVIPTNISVNNVTINSGVLNISAFTFSVNGNTSLVAGTVAATSGTVFCNGSSTAFGNGSGGPIVNAVLIVNSASILTQRTTFNNPVSFTKNNGTASNPSTGGNTFNSTFTLNYVSTIGNGYISMGNGLSDIFNGNVTLNNNSLDRIILCHNSNTNQFNGNVQLNQTGSSVGTSLSWNSNTGATLANGRVITIGTFNTGYLYLQGLTQVGSTVLNIALTGTARINVGNGNGNNNNTFNGDITFTAPEIWATGSTYNGNVIFNKTGASHNHNNGRQNIFNGAVAINNTSTGYFMLGYNSNDVFNDNITVTSTGTGGIRLGHTTGTGTPSLAVGKTVNIGGAGFSAGYLLFGSFTQLGTATINLNTTGSSVIYAENANSPCVFGGAFNATAADLYIRGATFNGAAVFTKTGGIDNHNNGSLNTFNSTCTINQTSSTGYFMLGFNSADQFNDDITVTSTGTGGIRLGHNSGTGTPNLATGKTVSIGGAGFSSGYLYFGRFTQLGSGPMNLNFTGATTALTFNASTFGGNIISSSSSILFNSSTFNGTVNATKTGASNDASTGGNTFNGTSRFINNGSGYYLLGNGNPDIWNGDVTFTNSGSERILPCYSSAGNQFNGNITLNSTGSSQGINFCSQGISTATLAATKTINTATFDRGYLILQKFTQLGSAAINLSLTATANYIQYGPSSTLGGNLTSTSPSLYFHGCTFNGTTDCIKIGSASDNSNGGNVFNGVSNITNNGTNYLLLGNTNPDTWNNDVTFTNNSNERILPAWATAGNQFNGNIYVNTTGSALGIQFCGGNATATATLAATKSVFSGGIGLNAGYLILKQFIQLGNAPINLTLSSTATYLQYGPTSLLGGNVTSVSPRLLFNGCTFNGTVNCTKNGATDDASIGNNIFNGTTILTNTGSGYLMFGNGNPDQFNGAATFNNTGSNSIYVANNSSNNVFSGATTFNNSPTANTLIYVSPNSAGTIFNENIVVTSTNGQGVQFCGGNATATATLAASKTISIGGAGFSAGTLLLKQFTQVGNTAHNLTLTGTGNLTFGPLSSFGGDVTSTSPILLFNGCNFNRTLTSTKTGATNDASTGANIFNDVTVITNNGAGYLLLGNTTRDQFNAATTFNNNGYRFYFAHNHNAQTTRFASDLTLNSNKTVSDGWSYLVCEGTNASFSVGGNFTINNLNTAQSNMRFLQGTGATATYSGNVSINLTNSHSSTQIQMGTVGISTYYGNITVSNTLGGTSSGVFFNIGASASSTLGATKTISLGTGGFVSGDLSLIRFTQLGGTGQSLSQTTGTARLILGPTSIFNGDVNFNFPQVSLNGTTYNGLATIQKNGATDNAGIGGNVFNGTTIINNSGSGYLMTGNGTSDAFNGITTFNNTGSYRIYFAHNHSGQTTTFSQTTTLNSTKSGGADSWSYLIAESANSNVRFDGDLTINIAGTIRSDYRIINGATTSAIYNGNLNVNLTNTNANTQINLGTIGRSTYNGNITVVNTGAGTASGVFFNTSASATSTLAITKIIGIGAGGFNGGTLSLIRFTQLGNTTQTLSQTTGTGILIAGPTSTFNGDVNFNFPQVSLNGTTYNGLATIQKNGVTDNDCVGGNIFNGTTSITNISANRLRLANTTTDAYNGNVTFVQNNSGVLAPNFNANCTYVRNVTISSTSNYTITFGSGTGIATFNGGNPQTINKSGSVGNPVFTRLVLSKSANSVTLNTRSDVSSALTLTQGIINTTSTNILNMLNASTTTIGNSLSYVNGPINYDMALSGTRTLNFPIGKAADWRPVILTAVNNSATSYTYKGEVTNANAFALGYTRPATVDSISKVHYWDIDRTLTSSGAASNANVSGNQTITLYYGTNDFVTDPSNLTIVKNTSASLSTWFDIGGAGATVGVGSVSSTSAPSAFTSYSRFSLANKKGGTNPLPIELLYFTAKPIDKTVSLDWATASETNNSYFEVERSADGINFEYVATMVTDGNGNSVTKQVYHTIDTKPYKGVSYYRLKQVDKNTSYKYADIVSVEFITDSYANVFPNPVSNILHVKASEDYNTANIKVINILGVEVFANSQLNSYNGAIDLSHLASGVYYVVIEKGEKTENIKISIQK